MARYPTGRSTGLRTLLSKKRTATSAAKLKGKVHKKSSRARRPGPQKGKKMSAGALPPARGTRRGRKPRQGLALLHSSKNKASKASGMCQGRSRSVGTRRRSPAPSVLTRKRPAARRGRKRSPAKQGRNRSTRGRGARAPRKGMGESPAKRGGRKPRCYLRGG